MFGLAAPDGLVAVDPEAERSDRKPVGSGSLLNELTKLLFLYELEGHLMDTISVAVTGMPKRSIIIRAEYALECAGGIAPTRHHA
jgi:hypothetical protein